MGPAVDVKRHALRQRRLKPYKVAWAHWRTFHPTKKKHKKYIGISNVYKIFRRERAKNRDANGLAEQIFGNFELAQQILL